ALIDGHGGNRFNLQPVKDKVTVVIADIRDEAAMKEAVKGKDYIFHLAGQNDHVISQTDPYPDIDINIKGSAVLLEACRKSNPKARVIYTGTRGEYGPATRLPVREDDPTHPKGIYELSNLTAQKLFKIYNDNHGIRSVTLRLTNIYGERAQMKHSRFGVVNWFVRLALDSKDIPVFGNGLIKRDFLYVQDTVDAIIACAATDAAYGELFNVGHDRPSNFLEVAKLCVELSGRGKWDYAPFSPERAAQEPGDFYSDISKIKAATGWEPKTALKQGLAATIDYYRKNKERYW
ncbi:MAG TPA: NAD-dependent epimerase/dehydratase family protein, partial [Candidatus Omnitrophota bacterium]|nr:NAD-dependent epimerase/dehydratase family protein [Candidatus Omnitrophota bacterium]